MNKKNKEIVNCEFNKVFLGIFVVVFGLIILLNNLSVIDLNVNMWLVWPIFIIFLGLSLFTKKDVISTSVGLIVSVMTVVLICVSLFGAKAEDVNNGINSFPIVVSSAMEIEKARIQIDSGMGDVSIYGERTENLIQGTLSTNFAKVTTESETINNVQDVNVIVEGNNKWKGSLKNELSLGISKDTLLDLVYNSGASINNLDLSELKAESVVIRTGASSLNLKIGDIINESNVSIEAGASSIVINLPKSIEAKILVESALSSKELNGLSSVGDNIYKTSNYDLGKKKVDITIKAGMASIVVNWYNPVKKSLVNLYYYKSSDDKEVSCDNDFVLPVKRDVLEGENMIKDVIELLIQGKLTQEEKNQGFTTEFPNKDFKLNSANLSDKGVLTLNFTEVPGFTTGGSCRMGLLASEIIKTAEQFPQVKEVVIEPESLFQP
ncbi:MAG: GerMN domain-containing protein [Candidatus Pacebacteria bacterium]|nr:GerMN domain-containing protein [Candidatus Paceibacterota bacterium]